MATTPWPRWSFAIPTHRRDDAIVHHGVPDADTRFLSKPFTLSELTNTVREVLDES